jgi:hypothetical protein
LDFKIQTIEKLFFYIVASSYLLIPLSLFFLSKSKVRNAMPIILGIYGVVFFSILLAYDYLPSNKEFRKFVQQSYTFLEYSFFAFIFWSNIFNKRFRNLIVVLSILFFVFQIVYFFISQLKRLDSIPIGIETILILIYISLFFFETFKRSTNYYIYNHYCFWVSVGILIYLGGSFFFYILINDLSNDQIEAFGKMTYVSEIIKNLLFCTGLYIYGRYPIKEISKKNENIPYLDMI